MRGRRSGIDGVRMVRRQQLDAQRRAVRSRGLRAEADPDPLHRPHVEQLCAGAVVNNARVIFPCRHESSQWNPQLPEMSEIRQSRCDMRRSCSAYEQRCHPTSPRLPHGCHGQNQTSIARSAFAAHLPPASKGAEQRG